MARTAAPGIRAALCHDLFTARQSREDDDANVLCLGARVLDDPAAIEVTRARLEARFSRAAPPPPPRGEARAPRGRPPRPRQGRPAPAAAPPRVAAAGRGRAACPAPP